MYQVGLIKVVVLGLSYLQAISSLIKLSPAPSQICTIIFKLHHHIFAIYQHLDATYEDILIFGYRVI